MELQKLKRNTLYTLAILLIVSALAGSYLLFGNYSEGFRTGYVVKFSRKGLMFKTWEGQLMTGGIMGGMIINGNPNPTFWEFSATHLPTIKEMNEITEREPVKLYYREKFFRFPWRGETKYFINRVERIPGN